MPLLKTFYVTQQFCEALPCGEDSRLSSWTIRGNNYERREAQYDLYLFVEENKNKNKKCWFLVENT